ncbi:MAG: molybdopterin biosynthesis protein [Thermoprotei archaeon]|nr:MAG: molybdopterin biosynthesis protein [Thermoprotei archaeon]
MGRRRIYHRLVTPEEALKVIENHIRLAPLGVESLKLREAVGRVLAEDVRAVIDVPPFDRSTVDGYAVRAEDTYVAEEYSPVTLRLVGRVEVGEAPRVGVGRGECVEVATGAPIPPGANAVVMVEYAEEAGDKVLIYRKARVGEHVSHAGSDALRGEILAWRGTRLTPELIGALAAAGVKEVKVYRQPVVAIIATGNELLEPGRNYVEWRIYDADTYLISAALAELSCKPLVMGICRDDEEAIRERVDEGLRRADVVLVTGGTSAGMGDLVYRVLDVYDPGVLVHGLKLRPGKPTVVAASGEKLIFGLPGFPLSCYMTFTLLVKPVLARLAGLPLKMLERARVRATLAVRIAGAPGYRRLVPVLLRLGRRGLVAYPVGGDSGSIHRLSASDGFVEVPEGLEQVLEGEEVEVTLFRDRLELPDLTVIGSHCPALEKLLTRLGARYRVRCLNVGSLAGLRAVIAGAADAAGIHLYDEREDTYNLPYLRSVRGAVLVRGYVRRQGLIVARGNPHNISSMRDVIEKRLRMVNRVKGSGTRALVDKLIGDALRELGLEWGDVEIPGYSFEARTHNGVALAVLRGLADVGVGIEYVARLYGLDFVYIKDEVYDFVVSKEAMDKESVKGFLRLLHSQWFRHLLSEMPGYEPLPDTGQVIYVSDD